MKSLRHSWTSSREKPVFFTINLFSLSRDSLDWPPPISCSQFFIKPETWESCRFTPLTLLDSRLHNSLVHPILQTTTHSDNSHFITQLLDRCNHFLPPPSNPRRRGNVCFGRPAGRCPFIKHHFTCCVVSMKLGAKFIFIMRVATAEKVFKVRDQRSGSTTRPNTIIWLRHALGRCDAYSRVTDCYQTWLLYTVYSRRLYMHRLLETSLYF